MKCYLCKRSFDSIKFLLYHFRIIHKLKNESTYVCAEYNCTRSFSYLDSFRKHLQKDHPVEINCALNTTFGSRNRTITQGVGVFPGQSVNNFNNSSFTIDDSIRDSIDTIKENCMDVYCKLPTNDELRDLIEKQKCTFMTSLYSNKILPRNTVQLVVDEFQNLNSLLQILKSKVLTTFEIHNVSPKVKDSIASMFKMFSFENLQTEYLRLKYLEKKGLYVKPDQHTIGENFENINGIQTPKNYKAETINIGENLKKFLEINGVLESMLKYVNDLRNHNNSVLSNVLQGELWKSKMVNFQGKIVFPILLNYDDFEIGNLVGSHAGIQQIGAAYISIPGIPPPYNSSLENIFPASYFYTADLKKYGNRVVFSKLINQFNDLEQNGIFVETKERKTQLYFIFIMNHGDNLGMNKILGYTQSFNALNYCRICRVLRNDARTMVEVDHTLLRTVKNYEKDCKLNEAGVKEDCVFNDVLSYNVVENYALDIMHDIWEGVAKLEMGLILHQLIIVDKVMSYEIFDAKLENFNFGFESCKPPKITFDNIKNRNIRMSAAEMTCFFTYAGIIFGSKIPEDNTYWSLYLKLREIMSLLMPNHFDIECCNYLKTLIMEHHEMYLKLFGPLKPKHHFMLHYPDIIKKIGPLSNISSMRYESKHREAKLSTNPVASRVNICHTLAIKQQLKFSHRLLLEKGFDRELSYGRIESLTEEDLKELKKVLTNRQFCIVPWVEIHNTTYKNGYIVSPNSDGDYPIFGAIQNILLNNEDNDIFFYLQVFKTQSYEEHLCAYNVAITSEKVLVRQSDLRTHSPQIKVFGADYLKIYVVPRL